MRCILVLLSIFLEILVTNGAVNYCGARICGHSDDHTYCKYRFSLNFELIPAQPGPSASCSGYMEVPLSAEEKVRVLARLNRRRSEVALGWRHWPPAGNMLKLRWIEELSREAQRWADQCRPPRILEQHDVCRDLYSISVGQCVASIVGEAPGLRPESMVDMWFMQSMLYDGNITSYIPCREWLGYKQMRLGCCVLATVVFTGTKHTGDFAQMMWSRTFLVGCGRSRFMADWRGRLRSVERLVCNFAPRGPAPARPLWSPAAAGSLCPPRSHPDTLLGLCTYHRDANESRDFNDSLSLQENYLLQAILEIDKNKSLDYLGSLDALYLTKTAIATIGTPAPAVPLHYSLRKRDARGEELGRTADKSQVAQNDTSIRRLISTEKPMKRTKNHGGKVNTVGRPKPYDMNDLNDAISEQTNLYENNLGDSTRYKEKDFYEEYGSVETEEDRILNSTTAVVVSDRPTGSGTARTDVTGFRDIENTTDVKVGAENYLTNGSEINDLSIGNISVDDYLSDPETARALQDALDQMERTLASPVPVSTPGKVRRELRNLGADLQKLTGGEAFGASTAASYIKSDEAPKREDRGPMLSMVLKYMPYLKPYESSIVGGARGHCGAARFDLFGVICGLVLHTFVW